MAKIGQGRRCRHHRKVRNRTALKVDNDLEEHAGDASGTTLELQFGEHDADATPDGVSEASRDDVGGTCSDGIFVEKENSPTPTEGSAKEWSNVEAPTSGLDVQAGPSGFGHENRAFEP